ncbi:hypothetical protein CNMCM5623_005897 [Aspergillus felis]|uniref:Uncharacterized protein n=1 Tax=Aspergillus felis TaxID=1287682 RepID=A0A8H6QGZ1_9EURO|nr:hypothetical protein CNMCM5623_005897 [Aspergillus felis]
MISLPSLADEWPPAYFADFSNGLTFLEGNLGQGAARPQFIRAVESGENQAAGRLFRGKCAKMAASRDIDTAYRDEPPKNGGGLWMQSVLVKAVFTKQVYSASWSGLVDPGDGDDSLKINRCQPDLGDGKDHRGFALLNRDSCEMQEMDLEATSAVVVAPPKTQPHPTFAETTLGALTTAVSPSARGMGYFAAPAATNLARET